MRIAVRIGVAAAAVTLAFGAVGPAGAEREAAGAAESACKQAVKKKYHGDVKVHVDNADFSQAGTVVTMTAKGDHWRCLASNDGVVQELNQQGGGAGAGKPAANVGSEWDRGCSDAKVGSYDRSKHSDAYEEGWQACKK